MIVDVGDAIGAADGSLQALLIVEEFAAPGTKTTAVPAGPGGDAIRRHGAGRGTRRSKHQRCCKGKGERSDRMESENHGVTCGAG